MSPLFVPQLLNRSAAHLIVSEHKIELCGAFSFLQHGYLECVVWLVTEMDAATELSATSKRAALIHYAARHGQVRWQNSSVFNPGGVPFVFHINRKFFFHLQHNRFYIYSWAHNVTNYFCLE